MKADIIRAFFLIQELINTVAEDFLPGEQV